MFDDGEQAVDLPMALGAISDGAKRLLLSHARFGYQARIKLFSKPGHELSDLVSLLLQRLREAALFFLKSLGR